MTYQPALTLAERIAPELGPDWLAYLPRPECDHLATLERETDGLCLTLTRIDGRGQCSPQERPPFGGRDMPDLHGFGILRSDEPRPRASFSPDRPARAIAGDVRRKVLEPFEPMRLEYIAKRDAKTDLRAELMATAKEIGGMIGSEPSGVGGQIDPDRLLLGLGRDHHAYGRLELSGYKGGRVMVEIHNLTLEDAREFARWISTRNRPLGHEGG